MAAKTADRRRAPRKRKTARIRISIWQNEENLVAVPVRAFDVSSSGLGLCCPIPLSRGEYFVLTTSSEKYLYRVVRCWQSGSEYRIGAARELAIGVDAELSHLNQIKRLLTGCADTKPHPKPPARISIF